MKVFERMLNLSYTRSGENRARLLLMSATPFMDDPMNFVKTVNLLLNPGEKLPTKYDEFQSAMLDAEGNFTPRGAQDFVLRLNGMVAYVDRTKDARYFATPRIERVLVDAPGTSAAAEVWSMLSEGVKLLKRESDPDAKSTLESHLIKFATEFLPGMNTTAEVRRVTLEKISQRDEAFFEQNARMAGDAINTSDSYSKELYKKCFKK